MTERLQRCPGALALAALILLSPGVAWGDGFSAGAEVTVSSGTTTFTDASGRKLELAETLLPQRYRLSIDKQFYPFLVLNANALYQWTPTWRSTDGVNGEASTDRWNVFASLLVGPPVLNATPYYLRRQETASGNDGGVSFRAPTLVNQGYGVNAGWSPAGLPLVTLLLGRNEQFDLGRVIENRTTDQLVLSLSYLDVKDLSVQYSLRWSRNDEAIAGVINTDLVQAAQVAWAGAFWDQRLATSVNYTTSLRLAQVQASGAGTVSLQQFPSQGLSLVEAFPATPGQSTLLPNPALIDGDLVASAGVDIGYAPSLAGDQAYRDIGVGFPNVATEVNQLRLWVDRQLPPTVVQAFVFSAWSSDDNVTWVPVPVTGPVTFGIFDNRFEVPIASTRARYVKLVVKPLATGVTVDPRYAAILVTELQPFVVKPASEVATSTTQYSGNFNGNARLLLLRDWNVTYQLALFTTHDNASWFQDWSVQNSFSAGKTLAPGFSVSGLLARTDSAQANVAHNASNRWSLQGNYTPIATLGVSATYAGQVGQFAEGTTVSNVLTLMGRMDPFQGVSLSASANYQWAQDVAGKRVATPGGSLSITLNPVPALAMNGTWSVISNPVFTQNGALQALVQNLLQASISFTPVRAIYFAAGVTKSSYEGQQDQTLVNFSGGFSPFAGGQLLLRFGYDENYDTTSRVRNRVFGPGVRWNIRPGTYLEAAYNWNDAVQPTLLSQARNFFATFFVSL